MLIVMDFRGVVAKSLFIFIISLLVSYITGSDVFILWGIVLAISQFIPLLQILGTIFILFFGLLITPLGLIINVVNMVILGLCLTFLGCISAIQIKKYFK